MSTSHSPTSLDARFNPFTAEGQDAMDDVLADARHREPVFFSSVLQAWVVTHHDDVLAALSAPDLFSSRATLGEPPRPEVRERLAGRVPEGATLIGWDDPEHRQMRSVLAAAFTARRARALAPRIAARVERLLDDLDDRATVDVLGDIALPVALDVVFDLIGVPQELRADCFAWSGDWGRLHGAEMEGLDLDHQLALADSAVRLHEVMADLIEQRRTRRADDLISAVLTAEERAAAPLTELQLLSLFPGLVFAGHETTANLVVNALAALLRREDRHAIAAAPRTLERFLEEAARLESPIAGMMRLVTGDTRLGGVALAAGDRVFLHFGSANRDATRFPAPEVVDLARPRPHAHLAFGAGPHACIGAALGRVEAATVLGLLLTHWPAMGQVGNATYAGHYFLRGLNQLVIAPHG